MSSFGENGASHEDEAAIRELIAKWSRALEAKDLTAMMADYSEGAVLYDACPPYKTEGREAIEEVWRNCLPCFPEKFRSEHRDLEVRVAGDIAFAYGLHHFVTEQEDHPCGQTWLRTTVCFRRIEGRWQVVHEHVSAPFNPMTNEVWPIRDPEQLNAPDYAAANPTS